jgi:hypothetical protein
MSLCSKLLYLSRERTKVMVVFAVCGCDVGVEKAYGQTIVSLSVIR